MQRIHKTSSWFLTIPEGWEVEGSNELVTLYKPDGVGMLRVLTAEWKSAGQDTAGELFRGHLSGSVRTNAATSTFQRTWSLSCRGKQLFVTYRCALKNAELELSQVDQIVQSISEIGHEKP
jgi:hypothetical protein